MALGSNGFAPSMDVFFGSSWFYTPNCFRLTSTTSDLSVIASHAMSRGAAKSDGKGERLVGGAEKSRVTPTGVDSVDTRSIPMHRLHSHAFLS